jgi:hypothetical protein
MNGACMAHFAKIENNVVTNVIVINNDVCGDTYPESEHIGQEFIANTLGLDGEWKQTSYNHNFRKHFGTVGMTYDSEADVFILPQPFPSWNLDSNYDWKPPTPMPSDASSTIRYYWDEPTQVWVSAD